MIVHHLLYIIFNQIKTRNRRDDYNFYLYFDYFASFFFYLVLEIAKAFFSFSPRARFQFCQIRNKCRCTTQFRINRFELKTNSASDLNWTIVCLHHWRCNLLRYFLPRNNSIAIIFRLMGYYRLDLTMKDFICSRLYFPSEMLFLVSMNFFFFNLKKDTIF